MTWGWGDVRFSALDAARGTDYLQGAHPLTLDTSSQITGIVDSEDTTTNRLLVSVVGSQPIPMPFAPGTYTPGEMVDVDRNYVGGTIQFYVRGRTGGTPDVVLPEVPPPPPAEATAVAIVRPRWTGTWRYDVGAYGVWFESRAETGGASTLYQGSFGTSGELIGVADYEDQVVNLGATAILGIDLTLVDASAAAAGAHAVKIRSVYNLYSGLGPDPGGPVFVGPVLPTGASQKMALDAALVESFRTGDTTALCLAGSGPSDYTAVLGTAHPEGMALTVTYTRPV